MRVGVVVRPNDRGLGIQTAEAARNLSASVLVIKVVGQSGRFPDRVKRYPDAPVARCHPGWKLDEDVVRAWLETVDAVYSAETFYDDRFADWAREAGTVTAIHANPEFVPAGGGWAIGDPTLWWSATSWRQRFLPPKLEVVPFPVATDRFAPVQPHDGPCRWLHVVGKAAMGDRNGTEVLAEAIKHLREPCTITIRTQDPALPRFRAPTHVTVRVSTGGTPNYWDLYADADALVMPRRYGGLCLPVQEAMAAGLGVLMTDTSPNADTWPVATVPVSYGPQIRMPCGGGVPIANADPIQLAAVMDTFADPVDAPHASSSFRGVWAESHSWEALHPELARPFPVRVAVVVPWRPGCPHREAAWEWVHKQYESLGWPVYEGHAPVGKWCKAAALQDAISQTSADVLVVADADVWTDNLPAAIAAIADAPWVVPHRVVYRLTEPASVRYMAGEPDLTDLDQEPYIGRAGGGVTIVTRDVWEQVPMDPRFLGWGDEDDAWCYALTTLIGRPLDVSPPT